MLFFIPTSKITLLQSSRKPKYPGSTVVKNKSAFFPLPDKPAELLVLGHSACYLTSLNLAFQMEIIIVYIIWGGWED